jgi:hypothetical protein
MTKDQLQAELTALTHALSVKDGETPLDAIQRLTAAEAELHALKSQPPAAATAHARLAHPRRPGVGRPPALHFPDSTRTRRLPEIGHIGPICPIWPIGPNHPHPTPLT